MTDASARSHRVIVQFAPSVDAESAAAAVLEGLGTGRLIRVSRRGRAVVDLPPDADAEAAVAALGADPRVAYAERDVTDTAQTDQTP